NVVVGTVTSRDSVSIDAQRGDIIDGNGDGTNITTGRLTGTAGGGIGAQKPLDTAVDSVDLSTREGDIGISNKGNLTVDQSSTSRGDIAVSSSGDITLTRDAVRAGWDSTGGGKVDLSSPLGSIRQEAPGEVPSITGRSVNVRAPNGGLGEGGF